MDQNYLKRSSVHNPICTQLHVTQCTAWPFHVVKIGNILIATKSIDGQPVVIAAGKPDTDSSMTVEIYDNPFGYGVGQLLERHFNVRLDKFGDAVNVFLPEWAEPKGV